MTSEDKRAPMAAGPMVYNDDGSVAWGDMWDSFCVLAQDGGPPHRGTMLHAPLDADPADPRYAVVVDEIARGVRETSGLEASAAHPGWIAVECPDASMASWLAAAIVEENVAARADGTRLFVPCGQHFQIKGEVKNVITAVAKTTHYWSDHIGSETKLMFLLEDRVARSVARLRVLNPFRTRKTP